MQLQRRSSEFIDPEVQGALAKRIAVHWLLYVGVATLLVIGLKWMTNPLTPLWDHVLDAWWTYGALLIVMLCLVPVFVYDAVKLSNRFAGPMLRLRRSLRTLAEGARPEELRLRDDDFWQEAAADLNRAVDRLMPAERPHDG